jgi:fatty acid synthase
LAGIRDLKTISLNSKLAELGLDSMTAIEIKDTLERDFDVYVTPQEMRTLTFARLEELSAATKCTEENKEQMQGTHTVLF